MRKGECHESRFVISMAALLGLVLAGCAASGARVPRTDANEAMVRGAVAYRERIALPPDPVVEVRLSDARMWPRQ